MVIVCAWFTYGKGLKADSKEPTNVLAKECAKVINEKFNLHAFVTKDVLWMVEVESCELDIIKKLIKCMRKEGACRVCIEFER